MEFFGIALVEWFGYVASVLVAVSLTMSSIVRLRWLNLLGASLFSVYGFIIGSFPVAFLNLFIVLTNIFYLMRMYREIEDFSIMELSGSDEYLYCFLDTHKEEIARLFPGFSMENDKDIQVFYLVKNAVPIGILAGRQAGDRSFCVELDFVRPEYRDFKMGSFVYDPTGFFSQKGFRMLQAPVGNSNHDHYLEKMGFTRSGDMFEKPLEGGTE
ncbi:hypothetical protein [Spirochaeta dissipatitropha]